MLIYTGLIIGSYFLMNNCDSEKIQEIKEKNLKKKEQEYMKFLIKQWKIFFNKDIELEQFSSFEEMNTLNKEYAKKLSVQQLYIFLENAEEASVSNEANTLLSESVTLLRKDEFIKKYVTTIIDKYIITYIVSNKDDYDYLFSIAKERSAIFSFFLIKQLESWIILYTPEMKKKILQKEREIFNKENLFADKKVETYVAEGVKTITTVQLYKFLENANKANFLKETSDFLINNTTKLQKEDFIKKYITTNDTVIKFYLDKDYNMLFNLIESRILVNLKI